MLSAMTSGCGLCVVWGTVMIDWKRVGELKEEIGADGFAEVADMFLEEAEGALRALAKGLPADEIEGQLHFLKGSALNLGLRAFAALCEEGEQMATTGDAAPEDLARLRTVYEASKTAFLAALARGAAA